MIWAARSMTSHQIVSSAILSRAHLVRTGAQTHGARYAHKKYSIPCFQPHIFSDTCSLTLSQTVLKGQDDYGAFALERLHSCLSTFTFNPLHFLLPLWCLRLVNVSSRHSESSFLLHLNGKDTLTCNMPKMYNSPQYFSDSCDHKNIFCQS